MPSPIRSVLPVALPLLSLLFLGGTFPFLPLGQSPAQLMAIKENGLPCRGYHDGGKIKCPPTASSIMTIGLPGF